MESYSRFNLKIVHRTRQDKPGFRVKLMTASRKSIAIKLVVVLLMSLLVWGRNVPATQGQVSGPVSLWDDTVVPVVVSENDPNAVELGLRFQANIDGLITGIRFYKGPTNTGIHVGNLWTNSGELLATATFANETASGWQSVTFAAPVPIVANTTYVASYHTAVGNYSLDSGYFLSGGYENAPLRALEDGIDGANGVYAYGASSFPDQSFLGSNYWVDVVFEAGPDATAPTVTAVFPESGAANVLVDANITATFNEDIDPASVSSSTFELRDGADNLITATVSYDAGTRTATLDPAGSLAISAFTATLKGGITEPTVKDLAGNSLAADYSWSFTTSDCTALNNPIVCENSKPGNPASEWDITGAGDLSIQGYTTDISVNLGETVEFKIDTDADDYLLDIYRLGYYGGLGARQVATVTPSATLPQAQPACLNDVTTGLIDCGNWAVSASWAVPTDAVSGIYFAKVVRPDTGGASHIVFVVRDDDGGSDILFQTADTTWQAYNNYGGNSLYVGQPAGRAYAVSYNRPFVTREVYAEGLGVQCGIPDGALAGAERLRRELFHRSG